MNAPDGLAEIISVFGDVHAYVDDSGNITPAWEQQALAVAELPYSLSLSWNPSVSVYKIRCHRLLAQTFADVFAEIKNQGLEEFAQVFGGCYAFRPQRTGSKLSTHAWGIAIDLNPAANMQGTRGSMDPGVVKIFESFGFEWGGNWSGRVTDPMHFQYATGY